MYFWILTAVTLLFTPLTISAAVCSPDSFHGPTGQRDFQAVQEFVNSKRTIPLEEKECFFAISGDVRFIYADIHEKIDGHELRGRHGYAKQDEKGVVHSIPPIGGPIQSIPPIGGPSGTGVPFSFNNFEVELNLYFDYVCGRSWAVAWLAFDENAGVSQSKKNCDTDPSGMYGSGCSNSVCLRKAYMGYNVYVDGCSRFDVELGRRPLYTIFDSMIQFQSNADGVFLKYARRAGDYGDFYWYGSAFIVDERADHYAWVTEAGFLNCRQTGFDVRFSFIDWQTLLHDDITRCVKVKEPIGVQYRVCQMTVAYNFMLQRLCMPAKLYGAVLYNYDAHAHPTLGSDKRLGLAWYAGLMLGQVCGAGDWALQLTYEYVEPYAIPDLDCSGIGRNGRNLLAQTITGDGRGFPNYKGMRVEGLYAVTDNLSIDVTYEFSTNIFDSIRGQRKVPKVDEHGEVVKEGKNVVMVLEDSPPSGPIRYSKFEVEAIYAF